MVFISGPFVRAHAMLQPPLAHALICTHLGDPLPPGLRAYLMYAP